MASVYRVRFGTGGDRAGRFDGAPCVRRRFLLQCLEDLDARLRKLNSRLFVIRGQPADVFPKLIKVRALPFFLQRSC